MRRKFDAPGFVDDVVFSSCGPYDGHSSVFAAVSCTAQHAAMLRGIVCVLSEFTAGVNAR